jgi:adenylate cyclase
MLITLALGALAAAASILLHDDTNLLDGLLYDLSIASTDLRPGNRDEPVAVIALDRDSLEAPELAGLPRVLLSPVWAKLVNGLIEADAKAIGFDVIFAYSANRLAGTNGQYDRDFLVALSRARERVVLARSARTYPAPPFLAAVFDRSADAGRVEPAAIGYAELAPDSDGVFRHVSAYVKATKVGAVPTLATALLQRAKGPQMPAQLLLAPRHPLEAIPTYRLIDTLRCIEHDPVAMRQQFTGKVVLVGTILPEEDRKPSPDRFMASAGRLSGSDGCGLHRLGASDPGSRTAPGVIIHAAAVESVLTGNLIIPLPLAVRAAVTGISAIAGAALSFLLSPLLATLAVATVGGLCLAAAAVLLGFGWWFPAALPVLATLAAMSIAYVVRFLIEDRRRRRVQSAFGHYLSPTIVNQLLESEAPLQLGGEEREVTIMFADLSGFTAMSGKLGPGELMAITNSYLSLIVEAVEATGGYVDKFIGDAVMAIWGAPAPHPDHAAAAASAALAAVAAILRTKAEADASSRPGYAIKIGLNSGRAVVGNVGGESRYNYTAVGEVVNIAARLESVPSDYGCHIVIGSATAMAIKDRFVINELDWIKLKGKQAPITIHELLGTKASAESAILTYTREYCKGLAHYRDGEFSVAELCWRRAIHPHLVGASPPLIMARRAAELQAAPPHDWDGIYIKLSK